MNMDESIVEHIYYERGKTTQKIIAQKKICSYGKMDTTRDLLMLTKNLQNYSIKNFRKSLKTKTLHKKLDK